MATEDEPADGATDDTRPAPVISDVIIDSPDPEALAVFWAAVLGVRVAERRGPYVFLEPQEQGPRLGFQRTDALPAGRNRVHLDLRMADPRAEQERIERLGGRRLHAYDPGGFLVMADPDGNAFCLLPPGSVGLDDHGVAHYLD